jgi:hypothetical protein
VALLDFRDGGGPEFARRPGYDLTPGQPDGFAGLDAHRADADQSADAARGHMENKFMARGGWNMKFPAHTPSLDPYDPDSELY